MKKTIALSFTLSICRFAFDILLSALWDLYRGRSNIHQGFMNPNKIIFCSVFQMVRPQTIQSWH